MASDKISRVGIVGAGQMGAGIAEVCARADVDALLAGLGDAMNKLARR